ncbi:MAG: hypothetical protein JXQ90_13600 [Cyclobacteriaceae bacterium]
MKTIALILITLLLISCNTDENETVGICSKQGTVLRKDYSKWICGGGWFLRTAEGDTVNINYASAYRATLDSLDYPTEVEYELKDLPEENACRAFTVDLACLVILD